MKILAEFSMFPTDVGESKSRYVSRSIDIIDKSGLPYKLGPMGTTIEGEWDEVMAVVKKCFDTMAADSGRIYTAMKIDYRKDKTDRLEGKIASIEEKLGKKLSK